MDIVVIIFVALCFLIGLVGIILPAVPGTGLIFFGILAYAWHFGTLSLGPFTLAAFAVATLLSFLFDYLGSVYGARRTGSTGWGAAGAIVGGVLGLAVLNVIGLFLGIFLGAALAEAFFAGKGAQQSLRIGLGSVLGFLGGTLLNFILGTAMIVIFIVKVLF